MKEIVEQLSGNASSRIKINVSGSHFETRRNTLAKRKDSRLFQMLEDHSLADGFEVDEFGVETYYFDRHAPSFPSILYFYQKNDMNLYRPLDVPMEVFVEEVIYFKLAHHVLENEFEDKIEVEHRTLCINSRNAVWAVFEKPETSKLAKISECESVSNINETLYRHQDWSPKSKAFGFWIIETTCIGFFTIEYILRLYAAPRRWPFENVKDFMNIIDLVAILPYYFVMTFNIRLGTNGPIPCVPEGEEDSSGIDGKFLTVLRVVRLARIVRIAKLSRHSRNLNTLIKTFRQSLRELSFLMLFFIVSMVLFATFVFFCEEGENDFNSIPHSFWWAIVTMTTVGYGDMYPRTGPGKVVGFLCAICGVLCIALPVPSIVSNFHRLYQEDQIMNPHGDYTYKDDDEKIRCKLRKKFLNDV
ncbi:Oidioi.mRNA.OKI2018_I69.XSR.g15564.t1.cds [Oikopleura dioica]|uniref:Oidioi.mRNA.OKI2018_I69.XSR.g15564.t1.cds n=1 Tax=Oikopleura dioica TaxID=34765 RepID=A0ABN7SJN1_OIKDI|nr:Oidioi.mRNA.OKI2018_I69.XSR.g15564.t1.cds [Oikopleura dioica]